MRNFATVILAKNALWTIGGFGVVQLVRFGSNVILTRLLAPELFGIMVIVNTLRTGAELFTDLGIGQSIIHNKNGDDPKFYNTAWTIQAIRGFVLWIIGSAAALPVAYIYHTQILLAVIPVAAVVFLISGFISTSKFLLLRRLQSARVNSFEVSTTFVATAVQLVLAYFSRTVWSLIFGLVFGSAITAVASYFILPNVRHRFILSQSFAGEIARFGRWIFFSSVLYFLSMSFDRLYLAGVLPLALLGIYGIARTISDMIGVMVTHLAGTVVFPFVASQSQTSRHDLRKSLAKVRLVFLLLTALGLSLLAANTDLLINLIFDKRYDAAAWMTPVLIIGTWFSVISSLGEAILLGFGKPIYGAIGNGIKFSWLLIGLPIGFSQYGVAAAIIVVATGDLFRYGPLLIGQLRERLFFGAQDGLGTAVVFGLMLLWEYLRWHFGLGTSFDFVPL